MDDPLLTKDSFKKMAWRKLWSMDFGNGNAEHIMDLWRRLSHKAWIGNLLFEIFLVTLQQHYRKTGQDMLAEN